MSGRRGRAAACSAAVVVAFAAALAVPGRERVLALFALVLVLGAASLAALVRLTAQATSADDVLLESWPLEERLVPQRDEIVRELEVVLDLGVDAHSELRSRLRTIAAARLADRRGLDIDRQPGRARAAIADELTWELVRERKRYEPVDVPRLRAPELRRVLDSLERI